MLYFQLLCHSITTSTTTAALASLNTSTMSNLCIFQLLSGRDQELCVYVHVLGDVGHSVHSRHNEDQPVQYGLCDCSVLLYVVWTGIPYQTSEAACTSVSIKMNNDSEKVLSAIE